MDELLKKILALPIFSTSEWNTISKIILALPEKTEKGLKEFFLAQQTQNIPVPCNTETTLRIIKFLTTWSDIAKELTHLNHGISTKWALLYNKHHKYVRSEISADDLLPLLVLSIPNEMTKLQLEEIQNKLDRVSFIAQGHISYCITNLYIAISAKITGDKPREPAVLLFYLHSVYEDYSHCLLEQIQEKAKKNSERLALYYNEIGKGTLDGPKMFDDEIQEFQKKHPDFCILLEKHKIIHDLLITLSRNNKPEKLLIEFEAKYFFHLEVLTSSSRCSYFFTNSPSPDEIKAKKLLEITTWLLNFINQKSEVVLENSTALVPT